jgi:predicted nucleic acid-binding protein
MNKTYKIYLDVCCLNRPFDDQTQNRIYLETQAIMTIINQCQLETWKLINSDVLDTELNQTPDLQKLKNVKKILSIAKIKVLSNSDLKNRTIELQKLKFSSYDAAHLASAEKAKADIFLTTDDRLLKKAVNYRQLLNINVNNPIQWLIEIL